MKQVAKKKTLSKRQWLLLYYAWRDPATPRYAKWTAVAAIIYLLSPVDIIPDVIPVAGLLDDVIIAPLLLSFATSMLPNAVREQAAAKASLRSKQIKWFVIVLIIFIAVLIVFWARKSNW